MSTISAFQYGILGIQRGLQALKGDAAKIASKDAMESNQAADAEIIEPLVNLTQDKLQIVASAKVIKRVDEAIGSLFDEKA
jgi:hypothetical protein